MNKMKCIIVVPDGLADYPRACLGGQTPMSAAHAPYLQRLARHGTVGRTLTVPDGFIPGSDVANMSILGYTPEVYFTGRASIEAVSHGIDIPNGFIATRLNFVSLDCNACYGHRKMLSFNAGGVSENEAIELLNCLKTLITDHFPDLELRMCEGFHHVVISPGNVKSNAAPPHEIIGQKIEAHLPDNPIILEFIKQSTDLLKDHPVNLKRKACSQLPVNAIWLWSSGEAISLQPFLQKTGLKACMITATDVLRGLARCAEIDCLSVPGANGTIDTNYFGKGQAAINALLCEDYDLAYIHIEAPDAAGHAKCPQDKITAIERIDKEIIHPIVKAMTWKNEDFRLLVLPDHYTSTLDGKHGREPVPYMLYDSTRDHHVTNDRHFCEACVREMPVVDVRNLIKILTECDSNDISFPV